MKDQALEVRDKDGDTAFLTACAEGSAAFIGLLAEAGCDKDAVSDDGGTALMEAALSGEAAAVRAVLDLSVENREARDKDGDTAFLTACGEGSVECINVLAEAVCDKAAVSEDGATALMHAILSGGAAAVWAVLELGVADREVRDEDCLTVFLYACNIGSVECMECIGLLVEAGVTRTLCHPAV